ncbi:extracellular protein [Litoreibacter ascidiaceicola]|uniref:Extracellular protein n=1 Tax=Litoreibacter ascidiaceicola TaxID=1486859 RepID=A0A1M4V561_9RHOB|nr:endo alpha-1,4 polygalactosaminidase [Litoreibacter ascidiaceicola]SHE64069.1 extracellular protein [Litoreibacter ascidiaceicola]
MANLSMFLTVPMAVFIIGGEQPAHWDWQLTEPLDLTVRVSLLITDMDAVTPEQIAQLKSRDTQPVCYISVGTRENYREDAADFPAHVVGKPLGDWPDEVYVDIRSPEVMTVMKARIDRCAEMGFVGVEPDNIDLFENENGFGITKADSLTYTSALADYAHSKGLTIAQKNAPELIPDLVDKMDFLLLEQCFEYDFCEETQPYLDAGKDVLVVEYTEAGLDWDTTCMQAKDFGFHLLMKDRDISAGGKACAD